MSYLTLQIASSFAAIWSSTPDILRGRIRKEEQTDSIRVFLADDHPMFVMGLRQEFEEDPDLELVGTATDGATAISEIMRLEPDIAVLDMVMPCSNGLQVLSALKTAGSQTRVIFLTGSESRETVVETMRRGAYGYLPKTVDWEDLIDAVKKAYDGHKVVDPAFVGYLLPDDERGPELTPRETEVLTLLAQDRSVAKVARELHITEGTVRTHLKRVYAKLEVSSMHAAIAEAMRRRMIE